MYVIFMHVRQNSSADMKYMCAIYVHCKVGHAYAFDYVWRECGEYENISFTFEIRNVSFEYALFIAYGKNANTSTIFVFRLNWKSFAMMNEKWKYFCIHKQNYDLEWMKGSTENDDFIAFNSNKIFHWLFGVWLALWDANNKRKWMYRS